MAAVAQFSSMEGGAELAAVFRELPDQLARNALASTGLAGAKVLQRAAYAQLTRYLSKRSAREDDVVITKSNRYKNYSKSPRVEYLVGPPRWKPWLRWLHDGTAPHKIGANVIFGQRRGGARRRDGSGGYTYTTGGRNLFLGRRGEGGFLANVAADLFFGKLVRHPGQPPRPWLFAAQWASEREVLEAMAAQVRKALPKQAKRLVSTKYRNQQLKKWLR